MEGWLQRRIIPHAAVHVVLRTRYPTPLSSLISDVRCVSAPRRRASTRAYSRDSSFRLCRFGERGYHRLFLLPPLPPCDILIRDKGRKRSGHRPEASPVLKLELELGWPRDTQASLSLSLSLSCSRSRVSTDRDKISIAIRLHAKETPDHSRGYWAPPPFSIITTRTSYLESRS